MELRLTVASVETHERLVVEVEAEGSALFSICRLSKEDGNVNVEFDLGWQGGGVVSVPYQRFVGLLGKARSELDQTSP